MSAEAKTIVEYRVEEYNEMVAKKATRLREVADRMEREARIRPEEAIYTPALRAAAAVHELHWGVANLHIDGLIAAANNVVIAKRDEEDR